MGLMARLRGEEPGIIKKFLVGSVLDEGEFGEWLAFYALRHGKLGGNGYVFRNVLVPRESGPTTASEIDVLLLHEKGIFVLESKNYSGWIFGSADKRQWTKSLPGGHKERFYNPIKQNRAHVRSLEKHLGLPEQAFSSYVVFSERCELKDVPASGDDFVVCKRGKLLELLRADLAGREGVFDKAEYNRIMAELSKLLKDSTDEARKEHVEEAARVASGDVCPYCGKQLVLRKGRYGEFFGCSGYPACKYTRKLQG